MKSRAIQYLMRTRSKPRDLKKSFELGYKQGYEAGKRNIKLPATTPFTHSFPRVSFTEPYHY